MQPHRPLALSNFGTKLSRRTGILELMDDLGTAMSGSQPMIMLGGGNPPHIPQVKQIFAEQMQAILDNPTRFNHMVGSYDTPQGHRDFILALVDLLNSQYQWNLTPENILLTSGSQTAFFFLFNLLAGPHPDGSYKHILLPLAPEYIGYLDQGIHDSIFRSFKPHITYIDQHTFKYHIDFDQLEITSDTAAICVSRPTNPTGNVLTDTEIQKLLGLAQQHHIPLIIDNAYGAPFPNIMFTPDTNPYESITTSQINNGHLILSLSLSKIGLPATRTGIIIANPQIINTLSGVNAIVSLAPGSVGPEIITDLIKSRQILSLSNDLIKPFYYERAQAAISHIHHTFPSDLPYYLHACEGSLFLWLYLPGMPITAYELYTRLKSRGVLIVPGNYFFPGIDPNWPHVHECIRINYSHDPAQVRQGLTILAQELTSIYKSI